MFCRFWAMPANNSRKLVGAIVCSSFLSVTGPSAVPLWDSICAISSPFKKLSCLSVKGKVLSPFLDYVHKLSILLKLSIESQMGESFSFELFIFEPLLLDLGDSARIGAVGYSKSFWTLSKRLFILLNLLWSSPKLGLLCTLFYLYIIPINLSIS